MKHLVTTIMNELKTRGVRDFAIVSAVRGEGVSSCCHRLQEAIARRHAAVVVHDGQQEGDESNDAIRLHDLGALLGDDDLAWPDQPFSAVLVVAGGRTAQPLVAESLAVLKNHQVSVLGFILNRRRKLLPRFIYRWV